MKNNVLKVSTSWLNGLMVSAILFLITFFISFILFIIDINYYLNRDINFLMLDSIVFPIQLILSILILLSSIYFGYNSVSWMFIAFKSLGKRKAFNIIVSTFALISTILIIVDTIYRIYYLFSHMGEFLSASESTLKESIFILQLWDINPQQPTPFLIMIVSLVGSTFYISIYFAQKKFFKSESIENSQQALQNHYTNNFIKDRKRSLARSKPKDLLKKIKVF
ncbi:MAG: hypothetical protein RR665_00490 [Malacoplasma sp.]